MIGYILFKSILTKPIWIKLNLQKGDFYVYWQRKRVSILKRILWKRQNWRMRMFCCLHWIHFMDETEDSIDVKVNYKRKVNYEHLAECSISMNIMSKDTKNFRIWVYKSHPQRMALIHKNRMFAVHIFYSNQF